MSGQFRDHGGEPARQAAAAVGNVGNCMEVAVNLPGVVGVRDSQDPAGPALTFSPAAWRAFVTQVAE
ncbi:DUF397 domain-containing protein [Micromonospora sp. CPCC 206060]|uniref:DUF397 domain-containing protein n=1 Tax=Micromonospora sp. CPCC 206060 TaxID=3122406 RepID=UPI002FF3D6A9